MSPFAILYNVMLSLGLTLQTTGVYLLFGAGWAYLSAGASILSLSVWASFLMTRGGK